MNNADHHLDITGLRLGTPIASSLAQLTYVTSPGDDSQAGVSPLKGPSAWASLILWPSSIRTRCRKQKANGRAVQSSGNFAPISLICEFFSKSRRVDSAPKKILTRTNMSKPIIVHSGLNRQHDLKSMMHWQVLAHGGPNPWKVVIVLEELGVPYECVSRICRPIKSSHLGAILTHHGTAARGRCKGRGLH